MKNSRQEILRDLKELPPELYGRGRFMLSDTGKYTPMGWLAHKAGVPRRRLESVDSRFNARWIAEHYGLAPGVTSRLAFFLNRAATNKRSGAGIKYAAQWAVTIFDFKTTGESRKKWQSIPRPSDI